MGIQMLKLHIANSIKPNSKPKLISAALVLEASMMFNVHLFKKKEADVYNFDLNNLAIVWETIVTQKLHTKAQHLTQQAVSLAKALAKFELTYKHELQDIPVLGRTFTDWAEDLRSCSPNKISQHKHVPSSLN